MQSKTEKKKRLSWSELKELKELIVYLKPYKWYLIAALFLLVLSSLLTMIFPYLAGVLTDVATGTEKLGLDLHKIGYVLIIVLIVQGIVSFCQVMLNAVVSENAMADLRTDLYNKMISLPLFFFEKNRIGDLLSRVSSDVAKLQNIFSTTFLNFVRQVLMLLGGIILLLILTPKLSLIMLGTFPFIVIGALFFGRYLRKFSKKRQEELAQTNVIVEETLQNIQTVKSFTSEGYEIKRYKNKIDELVQIALRLARVRGMFASFIIVLLFGGLFGMLWLGAWYVSNGAMTIGELVTFIAYTGFIGAAIASLGSFYTEIVAAVGGSERIREILKEQNEFDTKVYESHELKGRIQFKDVHFAYPSRPSYQVLKGISFEVQAGQRLALVGQSGAGKSTIIQLLMRYYPQFDGEILVDNRSVDTYNFKGYRENIAVVPQEIILFGGTLRENILYGKPNATEEELIHAAKQSNCYEFISKFPEGFDTTVGERGIKLSGGQKQRVAIARAILKNPSILILDEATSSLDSESEQLVQEALNNLMVNRTSIIIAHRLSTIKDVDKILVIEDGQISESGTHEALYSIEGGKYATLAKRQFE